MTSPFNWRGHPSELAKSLQKDEIKRRNANSGKAVSLQKRTFHMYQKAVPNVFTKKP